MDLTTQKRGILDSVVGKVASGLRGVGAFVNDKDANFQENHVQYNPDGTVKESAGKWNDWKAKVSGKVGEKSQDLMFFGRQIDPENRQIKAQLGSRMNLSPVGKKLYGKTPTAFEGQNYDRLVPMPEAGGEYDSEKNRLLVKTIQTAMAQAPEALKMSPTPGYMAAIKANQEQRFPQTVAHELSHANWEQMDAKTRVSVLNEFDKEIGKNNDFATHMENRLYEAASGGGYIWADDVKKYMDKVPSDRFSLKKLYSSLPNGVKEDFLNELQARQAEFYSQNNEDMGNKWLGAATPGMRAIYPQFTPGVPASIATPIQLQQLKKQSLLSAIKKAR